MWFLFFFSIGLTACRPNIPQADGKESAATGASAQVYLPDGDAAAGRQRVFEVARQMNGSRGTEVNSAAR